MTREEAKQAAEVLKAYADGKKIEISCKGENDWSSPLFPDATDFGFDFDENDYRVAKEPQYRPFANAEECWNEMLKHQPFGWAKDVTEYGYYAIYNVYDDIDLGNFHFEFDKAFKEVTFADGEPFGIKIE